MIGGTVDVGERRRVLRLFVGTVLLFFGMSAGTVAVVASRVHSANRSRQTASQSGSSAPSFANVSATEWKISPATVQAGAPISLHFMNDGQTTHQIAVEANGKTYSTQVLQAGGMETLNVPALPGGSYHMFCSIPGHRQLGMDTTLTVGNSVAASPSPANMDQMEQAALKAFPAKTQGIGNVPLKPRVEGGVKVFELTAKMIQWEVTPGQFIAAYAYNGMIPGPAIEANRGDRVRIVLHNELPESTTIHFHGVTVPNSMDGVPFLTQPPVEPGATFTYSFNVVDPPGTYMYHTHMNAQYQMSHGLYGAFIVNQPKPAWNVDQIVFLGDGPLGFNINGKGFPATQPIVAKLGQRVHVRFLNAGELLHPMHLHGFHFTVLEEDGQSLKSPYTVDTLVIAPGETYDVVFVADHPGAWAFHCHILSHAESEHGMYGMVTAVVVNG